MKYLHQPFPLFCQRSAIPLVKPHNFMHPDDHLILEDESGRVTLAGAIPPAAFVTGKSVTSTK